MLRAAVSRKPASTLRARRWRVWWSTPPCLHPCAHAVLRRLSTGETLNPAFQFLDFGKRPFLDLETITAFATSRPAFLSDCCLVVRLRWNMAARGHGPDRDGALPLASAGGADRRRAGRRCAAHARPFAGGTRTGADHGRPAGATGPDSAPRVVVAGLGHDGIRKRPVPSFDRVAFVLASLPFTAYMTLRAAREERWKSAAVPVLALAALLAAILATPLLPATVALIRFLWENSSIHLIANAIAWTPWSRGLLPVGTEATIFQSVAFANLYRFLWIVPALGGIVWLARRVAGEPGGRTGIWLASLAALIGLPLMPTARPGESSGTGTPESVTFVCGALAVFLLMSHAASGARDALPHLSPWPWSRRRRCSRMEPEPVVGERHTFLGDVVENLRRDVLAWNSALGPALAEDRGHLAGLVEVKAILGKHLRAGETFLDLTDRPALYTYFGFPTPMRWTCGYHVVKESWQKRAIEDLEKTRPPLVIVDFANYRRMPARSHCEATGSTAGS